MAPWLVFAQIPEHEPHVSNCLPELLSLQTSLSIKRTDGRAACLGYLGWRQLGLSRHTKIQAKLHHGCVFVPYLCFLSPSMTFSNPIFYKQRYGENKGKQSLPHYLLTAVLGSCLAGFQPPWLRETCIALVPLISPQIYDFFVFTKIIFIYIQNINVHFIITVLLTVF